LVTTLATCPASARSSTDFSNSLLPRRFGWTQRPRGLPGPSRSPSFRSSRSWGPARPPVRALGALEEGPVTTHRGYLCLPLLPPFITWSRCRKGRGDRGSTSSACRAYPWVIHDITQNTRWMTTLWWTHWKRS